MFCKEFYSDDIIIPIQAARSQS